MCIQVELAAKKADGNWSSSSVDRWLIWKRKVTRFSLGRQVDRVDLKSSFLAVRVQRWTDVFHHPEIKADTNV